MRRLLIGPLAASAAMAALLVGSATAASATHTVEVDNGTVLAKGAAVIVPVTVTCLPGTTPFPPFPGSPSVGVSLTQRSGNRIAQGFGSASVVCDGTPQTVNVQLTASQAPFKNGTALATASMTQCDPMTFQCHTESDTEEIQLRK